VAIVGAAMSLAKVLPVLFFALSLMASASVPTVTTSAASSEDKADYGKV